jgi:hypothetical protein
MPEPTKDDQVINFNVNPENAPVLAADSYLISSNENFVVLGFAQNVPGSNVQHIVSRVAMSPRQTKEFLEKLHDHIQKFEV